MNTEQLKTDDAFEDKYINPIVDSILLFHSRQPIKRLSDFVSQEIQRDLESRWISVKDRLPDDGQMVLIQSTDNAMFPVVSRYRKSHKLQFIIPYRSDLDVKNVTHWQPLPEPPKQLTP